MSVAAPGAQVRGAPSAGYHQPVTARGEATAPGPPGRIRVLVAIKTLGPGGAERLLAGFVASARGGPYAYEVAYVMLDGAALAPDIRAGGTPVHGLGATSNLDLRWMGAFRRLLAAGDFAIVHFHLPYTAALGRLVVATLPRRKRPATVYTEHSLWNKVSPLVKALNRATIGRDAALLAVSDAAYDALPPALRRRARVVVHGVDLSASRAMADRRDEVRVAVRSELGVPEGELLAVTVAGLRSEKGYDVLLETARVLDDRHLPVRFAAAGTGVLDAELTASLAELGLSDRVRLLGHRDDALALMTAADLVVLPSRQEGLPVVLMEATSVGAPIVATAVGGVPQVITDEVNGLLVPPGEPDSLARAVDRLVADPLLRHRLGKQAMADASRYDITRATAEVEGVYDKILDQQT